MLPQDTFMIMILWDSFTKILPQGASTRIYFHEMLPWYISKRIILQEVSIRKLPWVISTRMLPFLALQELSFQHVLLASAAPYLNSKLRSPQNLFRPSSPPTFFLYPQWTWFGSLIWNTIFSVLMHIYLADLFFLLNDFIIFTTKNLPYCTSQRLHAC